MYIKLQNVRAPTRSVRPAADLEVIPGTASAQIGVQVLVSSQSFHFQHAANLNQGRSSLAPASRLSEHEVYCVERYYGEHVGSRGDPRCKKHERPPLQPNNGTFQES